MSDATPFKYEFKFNLKVPPLQKMNFLADFDFATRGSGKFYKTFRNHFSPTFHPVVERLSDYAKQMTTIPCNPLLENDTFAFALKTDDEALALEIIPKIYNLVRTYFGMNKVYPDITCTRSTIVQDAWTLYGNAYTETHPAKVIPNLKNKTSVKKTKKP